MLDCYGDADDVGKGRWGLIVTFDAYNRRNQSASLYFFVGKAEVSQEGDPGFFHPTDVIRVVADLHLVGFVVLNRVLVGCHCSTSFFIKWVP